MKKNGAAYGLFEGWIYPFTCCTCMKSSSAFCSSCISWYTFPGINDGAPGFSSMAWSQMQGSGNHWEASSLKTCKCCWYLAGIFPSPIWVLACSTNFDARVCFLPETVGIVMHAMWMVFWLGGGCLVCLLWLAGVWVHCPIHDSMAFLVHRMRGNCLLSIHPWAQLIFGYVAVNHGYPRIAFWSARSVRKKCNHTLWLPVCISRSV